ncbi:MAG: phosphoribosylformylglycinamidine cyclo-ligase [Gammaproteobacteria bacterium]
MNNPKTVSYKDAGVNIDAGNRLVERIKHIANQTRHPNVLNGLGGFAGLYQLPIQNYREPVLVSSTDGVGTKLKLAIELDRIDNIGIDLVAMCVNDLLVVGATPLFFLDYYATGQLDELAAAKVIAGIGRGCLQGKLALIGGETAEMPGMYQAQDFDLAGFCVGIIEKSAIIDGSGVAVGDSIIGIASSGFHSNGYSLIRKILLDQGIDLTTSAHGQQIATQLLEPTKIYVDCIQTLLGNNAINIHSMAHITGGGLLENIPRMLPPHTQALLYQNQWQRPAIVDWLQQQADISPHEMWRTFNCGIGMVVIIPQTQQHTCLQTIKEAGETAWVIGEIVKQQQPEPNVSIQ